MNILYISKLTGNLFAGPNNSVPAQVKAQSKIDNVFWYNINNVKRDEWKELNCYNLEDYPDTKLENLPVPFNKPDIVVIEGFYCYPFCKIINDINKNKIPYIIIPRCELTRQAQKKKHLKKVIGNLFYFKKMAKNASAIQFLSLQEREDSGENWNKNSFIISNGIDIPDNKKENFSRGKIQATYIGRYEKYQKGLDLLIEVISKLQIDLRKNNFILNMYGVDQEKTISYLNRKMLEYNINDLIKINDAVYGEEKKNILINTDVFILTSRFEGMPMGIIEALSYGIPCLVTKGTNMANDIKDYNAGWASNNSIDELTEAFKKMLKEKENFLIISDNARKLALQYSWDEIAKKSNEEFEKIVWRKE